MATDCVELGFVEEVDNAVCLTSPFFPSKVGGKPAWLALSCLPESKSLQCKSCEKPLIFLLQVYVPSDHEAVSFHRTVFVFCCRDGACYKTNNNACFAAFRCQLPRENAFYDLELREVDEVKHFSDFQKRESEMKWSPLCEVCGCVGEKKCARCLVVNYCSKEHQTVDWKRGHKMRCKENTQAESLSAKNITPLFSEYELVTEPEQTFQDKSDNADEQNENQKYLQENPSIESATMSDKEWDSLAAESEEINKTVEDKTFLEFKKRILHYPDQVLRYQRNCEPLWVSKLNMLDDSDAPKCHCGAERRFEFQILPQLLNHLKVDSLQASIDWGTLVIYTCSKDCSPTQTLYSEEFVWKQDFSETGLPDDILSKLQK